MSETPPRAKAPDDDLLPLLARRDVGVVEVDIPAGTIVRANEAFRRLVGGNGDLPGRSIRELEWRDQDARDALDALLTMPSGDATTVESELALCLPNGEMRWLGVSGEVSRHARATRLSALVRDISPTVRNRIECDALRERVEVELSAVRREREETSQALLEATRRRNEFLAVLSHELRNPLAPIRNATRIARTPTTTPDRLHWSLEVIERQVGHLARLLDDLLDVSRINRGKLELHFERFRLDDAIANGVEIARPLIDARRHRLHLHLTDEPIWIEADRVRLAQVFGNLLANAARFSETDADIDVTMVRDGSSAVVTVSDTGVGIPTDLLPQVFTMFTQAPEAGRKHGGLGIGLALVEGLVKLHQGTVEARSEGAGRGSAFTVRLPVMAHDQDAELTHTARPESAKQQAPLRILVADDNVDAADSLAILLRLQGHDVHVAHDGMAAIREAEAFRPDVALVDIGMPIMSGHDVARWIRSQPWGAAVTVVALTGWNQPMDRVQTALSGFDRHLAKPVSMADLNASLALHSRSTSQPSS